MNDLQKIGGRLQPITEEFLRDYCGFVPSRVGVLWLKVEHEDDRSTMIEWEPKFNIWRIGTGTYRQRTTITLHNGINAPELRGELLRLMEILGMKTTP